MKKLRNTLFALLFALSAGGAAGTVAVAPTAQAACNTTYILTIPPWYRGLLDGECNIVSPDAVGGLQTFVWRIALNVVEIFLHIVGYVAVGFVIYGGFQYLISTGTPDKIASAKKTITNALVGLLISMLSIGIVNAIVGSFTGSI